METEEMEIQLQTENPFQDAIGSLDTALTDNGYEPETQEEKLQRDAEADAYRRRVSKEGNKLFLASEFTPLPPVQTGEEFYNLKFPKQDWLFEGLVEKGQRVILSGYWKSGKTTAFGAALKNLCDGGSYMGVFATHQTGQCPVMYLNLEVPERTMYNYLFDTIGIKNRDRLLIQNLLGFNVNILNEVYFDQMQEVINGLGVCVLFIDPLRQFYSGDENDNSIAKEVCDRVDKLMTESDTLRNVFVAAHTGHANGLGQDDRFARPRGASKWGDWADVLMSLTRDGEDRFIAVRGRNGELSERRLRLTPKGLQVDTDVTRQLARVEDLEGDVLTYLDRQGGAARMTNIKVSIEGRNESIIAAIDTLEEKGYVTVAPDPTDGRAKLVSLTGKERPQE